VAKTAIQRGKLLAYSDLMVGQREFVKAMRLVKLV